MSQATEFSARAAHCRVLATYVTDAHAAERIIAYALELEAMAANLASVDLCALLRGGSDADGAAPYVITRTSTHWLISREAEPLVIRGSLESAYADAMRLTQLALRRTGHADRAIDPRGLGPSFGDDDGVNWSAIRYILPQS